MPPDAPVKFRQVTYVFNVQVNLDAEDNNYEFHKNIAAVVQRAIATRCPTVHVSEVNVQTKNFRLFPTNRGPMIRHHDEQNAQADPRLLRRALPEPIFLEPQLPEVLAPLIVKKKMEALLTERGLTKYYEQGPSKLFNVEPLVAALKTLSADEAQDALTGILSLDRAETVNRKGVYGLLVSTLLGQLQEQPKAWLDVVLAHEALASRG